jgi:two-component system, chemotaxis family, CheB/CheR fusion protein
MADKKLKNKKSTAASTVVAIGASAGGMEAIHELFDNMPVETNFSFVVIQHLSPDHKSMMGELLAKHTLMNVVEAENNMELLPNCIYVIPSRKLISISGNRIKLAEKKKDKLPNNAIDVFFKSLAAEKKKNAVGIILSGTGTDGTAGAELIKKQGGLVIVQDPATASFDGMPVSVITSGFADLILPPEIIAEELIEYVKEKPSGKKILLQSQKKNEILLRDILELIQLHTQQDFSHYKRPTLFRRLIKRMSELGITSLEKYANFLRKNEEEIGILTHEFLINVTKFFRDAEAFNLVRTQVIPAILSEKNSGDTVKVWCAACSSGEEAYSIAIMFHEFLSKQKNKHLPVKIFATDIDSDALEVAGKGLYPDSIKKDLSPDLLEKYFIREGNFYRISPVIRKMVVFAKHDILKDPPFSKLDLITCRNMLIYIDADIQKKILNKFFFAMNIDSYIFLGPSENLGALSQCMDEISRKWKIYRCVSKSVSLDREDYIAPIDSKNYIHARPTSPKNPFSSMPEIFKDTLFDDRKIAGIMIDKEFNVKQAIGNFKSFLSFPENNFNFNILRLVNADLGVALGVAVRKAIAENEKVSMRRVVIHDSSEERFVDIIVKPYLRSKDFQQAFLFIIIEELLLQPKRKTKISGNTNSSVERIQDLENELLDTRENLQAVIEELESTNEELQSTNEEMISTNEELQSTNEELQSLNEELHTVSAEHQAKIKELLELNDDLDNYFRNTEIGQILVDKKLIIRKFSPAVTKIINLIDADIGRSLTDITTRIKGLNFINLIKEVSSSKHFIEKEIFLDDHHYFIMRVNPYIKRDKSVDGVVINFFDISESKKLSSLIEGIFNSNPNGIAAKRAIRDPETNQIVDFQFLTVNNTYESYFNVRLDDIVGRRLTEVRPDVQPDHLEIYRRVVETGIPQQLTYHFAPEDRWFETIVVKMLDGIVTTHSDITEKKRASDLIARNYEDLKSTSLQLLDINTQLERSNLDLMQFASVASHDLKEPLRKIQAFGNILQEKLQDKMSPEENEFFKKMISASGRMKTMIEDVLTLSKLSNNELPQEHINLEKIVNRIIEDLEITIDEKNAKIIIGELPEVKAVPGQMHQLFQNLITNALKFNDKQQAVIKINECPVEMEDARRFNIIQPELFTCISISDNGIGFEDDYREKIFGLFQRLNGREYEGTGIGLSIAKKIVENHGGFISATGVIGKGADFRIILPVDKPAAGKFIPKTKLKKEEIKNSTA